MAKCAKVPAVRLNHEAAAILVRERGLNLSHAALAIPCDRAHLSNVLAGRRPANAKIIKGLADQLGVSPMALLAPEDPREALLRLCKLYKITPSELAEAVA